MIEKNSGVGGTWFENRYPGARVDSPSRTYTHTFGADFEYPNPFCEQDENEKYFNWVADKFGVRENIEFNTEVKSVIWDDDAKVWEIEAVGPDGPRAWRANAVISGVGFLARPEHPGHRGAGRRSRGRSSTPPGGRATWTSPASGSPSSAAGAPATR